MRNLLQLIYFDILQTYRQAHTWLTPVLFYVIVVSLFPLAMGAENEILQKCAPAIIWIAVLLAVLLSVGNIFQQDMQEGFVDVLLLSPTPLILIVFCKTVSHWLTHCLPLIIISPVLALTFDLNSSEIFVLLISLLLGTPVLSLIGAIGSALTVGIKQGGLLLPILIMPLYIPVLIFGSNTILVARQHLPLNGYFAIMTALILITLSFAPYFSSLALRNGVNQ